MHHMNANKIVYTFDCIQKFMGETLDFVLVLLNVNDSILIVFKHREIHKIKQSISEFNLNMVA